MGGPASSNTSESYKQAHEHSTISRALHPPKVWEQLFDDVYSIFKWAHLEKFFHQTNNLHKNIKFTMEEESLAFLDTFLKRNNEKISVLVYWMPTYTDQYLHYSSYHHIICKESVVSSLFNGTCSITTNNDDLVTENAKIVLKENGYQESIFKRINNNHTLS